MENRVDLRNHQQLKQIPLPISKLIRYKQVIGEAAVSRFPDFIKIRSLILLKIG